MGLGRAPHVTEEDGRTSLEPRADRVEALPSFDAVVVRLVRDRVVPDLHLVDESVEERAQRGVLVDPLDGELDWRVEPGIAEHGGPLDHLARCGGRSWRRSDPSK